MLNAQVSVLNECSMSQCVNALKVDNCKLNIAAPEGDA